SWSTTTSERRASIRPPEMMNGSRNGSSSSCSSTRAMRMGLHIEEMQLAVAPLDLPARRELQHTRDQAVVRREYQRMQRPLSAGAVRRGILGQGQLKECVQLDALAAAAGVLEDHAARADVAGSGESRDPRACARGQSH